MYVPLQRQRKCTLRCRPCVLAMNPMIAEVQLILAVVAGSSHLRLDGGVVNFAKTGHENAQRDVSLRVWMRKLH
jgi:hypothetical protein